MTHPNTYTQGPGLQTLEFPFNDELLIFYFRVNMNDLKVNSSLNVNLGCMKTPVLTHVSDHAPLAR